MGCGSRLGNYLRDRDMVWLESRSPSLSEYHQRLIEENQQHLVLGSGETPGPFLLFHGERNYRTSSCMSSRQIYAVDQREIQPSQR